MRLLKGHFSPVAGTLNARRTPRRLIARCNVTCTRWMTRLWHVIVVLAATGALAARAAPAQALPDRLADSTFWRMFTQFSEPNGYFQSDNFVSNEWELQYEIPAVRTRIPAMGAYVGVGPEQNLTYIAAFQPRIAFIVDIRRQNAVQHLLYKALIEMSADRAEFLSRLWSRPRPAGVDSLTLPAQLIGAYEVTPRDSSLLRANTEAALSRLVRHHGFALTPVDSAMLRSLYAAFFTFGPDITYSHRAGPPGSSGIGIVGGTRAYTVTIRALDSGARVVTRVDTVPLRSGGFAQYSSSPWMPSFADLMVADDGAGFNHGWLGSERAYRTVRSYHERNLIVPLVGNFAGPTALRAVGAYLRAHETPLSVFYLSNVEQYLFQVGDDWRRFYENVATMPYDSTSAFIRSVANPRFLQPRHPRSRMAQMTASIDGVIRAFGAGRIAAYYDVLMLLR